MDVGAYFRRIGFEQAARPDLETLKVLHRKHLDVIPFENLDVQLGRFVALTPEAVFDKLVTRRRGGWCYEMNGLFGWVLGEIGFKVERLSAGVMRERAGDVQLGNHLCLLVRLDQPYLVDVGFGGSLLEPIALRSGGRLDVPFAVSLAAIEDNYWRYVEQSGGDSFSFDFRSERADEALLESKCRFLQTDPTSPFIQNLVAQKRQGHRHSTLRGKVLTTNPPGAASRRVLASANELVATLNDIFNLNVPEVASLWPVITARHNALFPEERAV